MIAIHDRDIQSTAIVFDKELKFTTNFPDQCAPKLQSTTEIGYCLQLFLQQFCFFFH